MMTASMGVPVDALQLVEAVECPSCVKLGRKDTTQVRRYGYYPEADIYYYKCLQCVHPIKQRLFTFPVRFVTK